MSNPIKFTQEELAEIRMFQGKVQEKVFEFGQFRIERMRRGLWSASRHGNHLAGKAYPEVWRRSIELG
jgi:steroid 5-alpha reductase family enzyme